MCVNKTIQSVNNIKTYKVRHHEKIFKLGGVSYREKKAIAEARGIPKVINAFELRSNIVDKARKSVKKSKSQTVQLGNARTISDIQSGKLKTESGFYTVQGEGIATGKAAEMLQKQRNVEFVQDRQPTVSATYESPNQYMDRTLTGLEEGYTKEYLKSKEFSSRPSVKFTKEVWSRSNEIVSKATNPMFSSFKISDQTIRKYEKPTYSVMNADGSTSPVRQKRLINTVFVQAMSGTNKLLSDAGEKPLTTATKYAVLYGSGFVLGKGLAIAGQSSSLLVRSIPKGTAYAAGAVGIGAEGLRYGFAGSNRKRGEILFTAGTEFAAIGAGVSRAGVRPKMSKDAAELQRAWDYFDDTSPPPAGFDKTLGRFSANFKEISSFSSEPNVRRVTNLSKNGIMQAELKTRFFRKPSSRLDYYETPIYSQTTGKKIGFFNTASGETITTRGWGKRGSLGRSNLLEKSKVELEKPYSEEGRVSDKDTRFRDAFKDDRLSDRLSFGESKVKFKTVLPEVNMRFSSSLKGYALTGIGTATKSQLGQGQATTLKIIPITALTGGLALISVTPRLPGGGGSGQGGSGGGGGSGQGGSGDTFFGGFGMSFGGGIIGRSRGGSDRLQKLRYNPSISAQILGIRAPKPGKGWQSGLGQRPILGGVRRARRSKK